MDHKTEMHKHIQACADVLLNYIQAVEPLHTEGWVPAAEIKTALDINFVAVPKANVPRGEKGWFFATLARILEDRGELDYDKRGSRAYYRSSHS
jgi:hypothetical protein